MSKSHSLNILYCQLVHNYHKNRLSMKYSIQNYMIFLFQYKPANCEDKADNGDIVSVHYTVCTYMTASYLKALQWIPKERMFSHPYIFQARNLNQNCFNHLGAKLLLVNRIWHPLPLAFCYHFKLDCLNKKTKINRQNKK